MGRKHGPPLTPAFNDTVTSRATQHHPCQHHRCNHLPDTYPDVYTSVLRVLRKMFSSSHSLIIRVAFSLTKEKKKGMGLKKQTWIVCAIFGGSIFKDRRGRPIHLSRLVFLPFPDMDIWYSLFFIALYVVLAKSRKRKYIGKRKMGITRYKEKMVEDIGQRWKTRSKGGITEERSFLEKD